ncbi:MAG: DNA repair protein RadC [Culturomica sp.]|jgi:DNA repair protein RadC|nr:DNA repair protein RadC [Culturomica sp.]
MKEKHISIKEWANDERPREKLIEQNPYSLSINELIAIILRSGNKGESAVDLARRIMYEYNNDLNNLAKENVRDLMNKFKGIGEAKAAALVAAFELSKRRALHVASDTKFVRSSEDAYEYIYPILQDLDHEEFWIIFLNRSNKIIGKSRLSVGGFTCTVVDIRVIFYKALQRKSCSIIIAHNHPGGSKNPGSHDKIATEKIRKAGILMDVILQDHIIVGEKSYYSFTDNFLLINPNSDI